MSNDINKLESIFADALGIPENEVVADLEYNSIPQWDSIAHMRLISAIEDVYDIMIDTEDVIGMSSVSIAKDIVKKYVEHA